MTDALPQRNVVAGAVLPPRGGIDMDLTLWLLNRCTVWENKLRPGALPLALSRAGHDVALGQRVGHASAVDPRAATAHGTPIAQVAVNDTIDSPVGALMHEGHVTDEVTYDEYFVPIPVKCIGAPWRAGRAAYTSFWERTLDPSAKDLFAQIVGPSVAEAPGGRVNPAFDEAMLHTYWGLGRKVAFTDAVPSPFADVRMNTRDLCGYYQILREHTERTGRKNVLVGYSQGGTVARYLALLDEHVSAEAPCIHGIVGVQTPFRGSPLASEQNADWIAAELAAALLSIADPAVPGERLGGGPDPRPPEPNLPVSGAGRSTFNALAVLLDTLIHVIRNHPEDEKLVDLLRTTRNWTAGLDGDRGLAFFDLDPSRLEEPGAVLQSITTHPIRRIWCGAVVGTDNRLEEFVRGFASGTAMGRWVEWLARSFLVARLRHAEEEYRRGVMDVGGGRALPLRPAALERLRHDVAEPAALPIEGPAIEPFAHDFVIPSASQVMIEGTETFLGNLVNANASHISGAGLDTHPTTDLELACELLSRMT
jgi:hypothetical protein